MSQEFDKWMEAEGRSLLRAAWDAGFAAGAACQPAEAPDENGLLPDIREMLAALWEAAPEQARERASSKFNVVKAWKSLPKRGRPSKEQLLEAMALWKRSDKWRDRGGQFIPGLHRWIKERAWQDPPRPKAVAYQGIPPRSSSVSEKPHNPASIDEVGDILGEVGRRHKIEPSEEP